MLRTTAPLTIRRSGRVILSAVQLDISDGQIIVLRAPNGGGKTTLLRCLAGLIAPSAGDIQTEEDSVFCGHLDAVKATMTVAESLAFWQSIYGAAPQTGITDRLGLTALLDTPVSLLSAGQKRRLGLARAFIAPAPIKLFDEPTTALDAAHRDAFFNFIEDKAREGAIIIMSSNDDKMPKSATSLDLTQFLPLAGAPDEDPFLSEAFT